MCTDCERRSGEVETMDFWKTVGLPQSGFSICRYNCRCQLIPEKYIQGVDDEDLEKPILIKDPDLKTPANLKELGAAIKVNPGTLESYSDVISNIITDPRYDKEAKIRMLKSAFLGNKSLKKLGNRSRELIYIYTKKQYDPKNFKATTRSKAYEKNKSVVLTEADKAVVENYTGTGYIGINKALRGLDGYDKKPWSEMPMAVTKLGSVTNLEDYLIKMETALNKMVRWDADSYRGVKLSSMKNVFKFIEDFGEYKVGDNYVNKGFISSSTSKGTAVNWAGTEKNAIITIKGKNGRYVANFSSHGGENEVLFMPNSRFKIEKLEVTYRDLHMDELKTVDMEDFLVEYPKYVKKEFLLQDLNIEIILREL